MAPRSKRFAPTPAAVSSGRHFVAWIGLTPHINSSGGNDRTGRTSEM
ncbi:transposase [Bradyrhizobium sp. USDA 4506]